MPSAHSAFNFSDQFAVTFLRWDRHGEGDQVETAPDRLINAAKAGLMVARNEQLEHGAKFKLILPHEIGGHNVAAGHLFDPTF